jgi:hypothetical protein
MNAGPGDFILKESAARRAGRRALDALHGYAGGGMPIRVSAGEEYFPHTEVSRVGVDVLKAINGGAKVPGLADGGDVEAMRREAAVERASAQFQKKYSHWRMTGHSAGDVSASIARVFGGEPVPYSDLFGPPAGSGPFKPFADGGLNSGALDAINTVNTSGIDLSSSNAGPAAMLDSLAVDFSDLRNSLSPSISMPSRPERASEPGGYHTIDFRINGERQGIGRVDGKILKVLNRLSVRDQSTRAGKNWISG